MKLFGVIFTDTGSVPVGFYKIQPKIGVIKTGDYVSFCLNDSIAKMGLSRGYLKSGTCKNKSEELLKEVIAVPGNHVTLTNNEIKVSDGSGSIDYFAPSNTHDKDGLPVYRFVKNGNNIATGYWVYGFGSPKYSWDSRYYGEIELKNITHRVKSLMIF